MVRPDDQRVTDLRARAALRRLASRVGVLAKWQKNAGPTEVLATLEQIAQAVTAAKAAITDEPTDMDSAQRAAEGK